MPAEVLKLDHVKELLLKYANDYYKHIVPLETLCTLLAMVPKKGDLSVVQNFRPVSLVSTFLKLVDRLLLEPPRPLDEFLRSGQNGFRPARGTITGFNRLIQMLLERHKCQNLNFVAIFRGLLECISVLVSCGTSGRCRTWLIDDAFIDCIMQCYLIIRSSLNSPLGQPRSRYRRAILQGDTLAPWLLRAPARRSP